MSFQGYSVNICGFPCGPCFIETLTGPTFWDMGLFTLVHRDVIPQIAVVAPNLRLNEAFMIFAGVALAYNIVSR